MKKLPLVFLVSLASLFIIGCSDDDGLSNEDKVCAKKTRMGLNCVTNLPLDGSGGSGSGTATVTQSSTVTVTQTN